ncbi:hypothetical protein J6590_014852 [Homalodisca vitripennis]|nr:hypothetical protein J6590_014852 [Homalodisca vitripennis]
MSQNCCYKLEYKDPRHSFTQTGDQPDLDPSSSPGARHITTAGRCSPAGRAGELTAIRHTCTDTGATSAAKLLSSTVNCAPTALREKNTCRLTLLTSTPAKYDVSGDVIPIAHRSAIALFLCINGSVIIPIFVTTCCLAFQ